MLLTFSLPQAKTQAFYFYQIKSVGLNMYSDVLEKIVQGKFVARVAFCGVEGNTYLYAICKGNLSQII